MRPLLILALLVPVTALAQTQSDTPPSNAPAGPGTPAAAPPPVPAVPPPSNQTGGPPTPPGRIAPPLQSGATGSSSAAPTQ
jgi:hypothetical protein